MKAITINAFGETPKLSEMPKPSPRPDEVQIEVHYAGVNPVDWKICEGLLKNHLLHHFPLIPGWDVSGVISDVGEEVKNFKVGDKVFAYCRKSSVQWGSYAEYVCLEADHVVLKPLTINEAEAAAIPLVALTAWQCLFELSGLKKGDTILIHAGAGGVGGFAIAFAKYIGAKVYTTASAKNHPYVKELGADDAIDYTAVDFALQMKKFEPQGVDIVFDCAGNETFRKSFPVVKKGGVLVSIVTPPDEALSKQYGIHCYYGFVRPEGNHLKTISTLIDEKKIMIPPVEVFPLKDFLKAWEKIKSQHTKGKIVLKVQNE